MTRTILTAFLLLTVSTVFAQTPGANPATGAVTPSAVLRPALDKLQQTIDILRPEKWKAPAAVTAESTSDITSMQRDLGTILPPLLTTADAAPGSAPQLLPAYRNVEALYDVLVRVTQTSVLAAPAPQSAGLQQATLSLQQARREFGDLLQSAAQSQDHRLTEVQEQLRTAQSAPIAPSPICPAPASSAKKAKPRAKAKSTPPTATMPASQ